MGLRTYVATPLLTYCFQEEDATYCAAQFDDLMRKDTFDSDIWNNTECFTEEELAPFRHPKKGMDVYYLSTSDPFELYERAWLEDLFGEPIHMKPLEHWGQLVPDHAWVLVQRPHSVAFRDYFTMLQEKGIRYRVLHLSDEFRQDCIDFYTLPCCEAVVRNYWRTDVPDADHILTIPLGYHHHVESAKTFDEREWVWSFHGTGWFDRQTQLMTLQDLTPHQCLILPDWNHPSQLGAAEYGSFLGQSKFVPILRGNNIETFRFYECLEAGCIPIVVYREGEKNDPFYQWVVDTLRIAIYSVEEAHDAMVALLKRNGGIYQCEVADTWSQMKQELQKKVRRLHHSDC